jgi:hypothetical protein
MEREGDVSDKTQDLRRYRQEMLAEWTEHILPYWLDKVIDLDGDKFHGFVSGDDVADPRGQRDHPTTASCGPSPARIGR